MWEVARRQLRLQREVERDLPEVASEPPGPDFGLSPSQQRLWDLRKAAGSNRPAYNITHAMRLTGDLNLGALELALRGVVAQHEALRTVFRDVPPRPTQRVLGADEALSARTSIAETGQTMTGQTGDIRAWLNTRVSHQFDLTADPAMRIDLFRCTQTEVVLLLTGSNIRLDGRSLSVIFHELEVSYNCHISGVAPKTASPPFQHRDFIAWQAKWLQSSKALPYMRYWTSQLPADVIARYAPDSRVDIDYSGGRVELAIPEPTVLRLRSLATAWNISVASIYLTAYSMVLARECGQHPLLVGIPAANRGRPELRSVVGLLSTVLPVSMEFTPGATFRACALRAESAVAQAYAHQAMPIEHVVSAQLAEERPTCYPVDTFFAAYRDVIGSYIHLQGVQHALGPTLEEKDTEWPLMLTVIEAGGGTTASWSFQHRTWTRAGVRDLASAYVAQLKAITRDPDEHVL